MRSVALDRQRLAGVLVDDVQELDDPSVGGLVELVVERPDLVGAGGPEASGRNGRLAEASALAAALGDPEPLLAPEPLHTFSVEVPSLRAEARVGAAIAPARPLLGERTQPSAQGGVLGRRLGLMALGEAVLAGDPARPTLGEAEAVAEHAGRPAPAGRAQKFPGMKMAPRGAPPTRPARLLASPGPGDGAPRRRTTRGQAVLKRDGLRARQFPWPPLRLARVCREHESVCVVVPVALRDLSTDEARAR